MIEIFEEPDEDAVAVLEDFKNKVFAVASESVEWSTAPLVHFEKGTGRATEIRTGVLIEIADMKFLVTAAHDMIKHLDAGNILGIVLANKASTPVPLIDEKWWLTENPHEDICVCQLRPETVNAMGSDFRFLRLNQMMSQNDRNQHKGLYLLLGYPNAMTRPDEEGVKRADTWKYLTTPFHGDYAKVENYDKRLHLVLDYDRKTMNREGKTVHPPGLSGCGVYFSGLPITHPLLCHDDFKLVAIQTSWHRGEQYAKTTWIDLVLLILWRYYSDTRAPMSLHGITF